MTDKSFVVGRIEQLSTTPAEVGLSAVQRVVMREAADELTRLADELKECSTINGEWDGTEEAAKVEYDRLMNLVMRLRA